MLNLAWAKTFLTLIDTKSLQAAADQLQMAQPTVSQQIRKLEEELGVLLLHRSRIGCEPTEAALTFMPYAQSLVRISEHAVMAVRSGRVRVGASANVGIYVLQPYLRKFLRQHDPALFDLLIDRNPVIAQKLYDSELDVAIMEWWEQRPGFSWKRWRSEPLVLIVPPDHPLCESRQISKRKLAEMDLLGGEPGTGTGRLLESYFGNTGRSPRLSMQLGSTEAVKEAVRRAWGFPSSCNRPSPRRFATAAYARFRCSARNWKKIFS